MKSLATSPDLHLDLKRLEKSKCKSGRKAVGIFSKASNNVQIASLQDGSKSNFANFFPHRRQILTDFRIFFTSTFWWKS